MKNEKRKRERKKERKRKREKGKKKQTFCAWIAAIATFPKIQKPMPLRSEKKNKKKEKRRSQKEGQNKKKMPEKQKKTNIRNANKQTCHAQRDVRVDAPAHTRSSPLPAQQNST